MHIGDGACAINSGISNKIVTDGLADHVEIDWNRSVFLVINPDGGVLFDLDNDEMLKLDPVAAEIWEWLARGVSKREVAEFIAQKYSIEKNRAAEDIDNLLQAAATRNINISMVQISEGEKLHSSAAQVASFPWYGKSLNQSLPTPDRWTIVRALIALLLFDSALSIRSLKFVCKLVHHWRLNPPPPEVDPGLIGKVCAAVEVACVWYPKKAVCLQRSAVTACLLRSAGIPGQLIIGARVMPLNSHAWVEVDGAVVNDHSKIRDIYQRLIAF